MLSYLSLDEIENYSSATMERPTPQQLLAEIKAGRVDIVVVYKVDRLTRSLADFGKIVEIWPSGLAGLR
jgi:DNA invertase Pin-like site-specific DNA recombinase